MYDIIFISYNEPNADNNYAALRHRFPMAKRVHGVKGIHHAHVKAAKKCFTKMFWVVDADAKIMDSFNFDYVVPEHQLDHVHVWRSINPVNKLEYGYGGVKLLPRMLTVNMDTSKPDMTTNISNNFKAMPEIANITAFNTDEFSTWRSAFRECAKLASRTISGQIDDETEERLNVWTTIATGKFSKYALQGADAGKEFGNTIGNRLELINNFDWLKEQFNAASI